MAGLLDYVTSPFNDLGGLFSDAAGTPSAPTITSSPLPMPEPSPQADASLQQGVSTPALADGPRIPAQTAAIPQLIAQAPAPPQMAQGGAPPSVMPPQRDPAQGPAIQANGPPASAPQLSNAPQATPGVISPLARPVTNHLGDVLDSITGGHFAAARNAEYQAANSNYITAQRDAQLGQIFRGMTPEQQKLYQLSPEAYTAAQEANVTTKAGDTTQRPGQPNFTAPQMGMTKDGVGYTQTTNATMLTGSAPTIQKAGPAETISPMAAIGPQAGVAGAPGQSPIAPPQLAASSAPGTALPPNASSQDVANSIYGAAARAGLSPDDGRNLVAIAKLESNLNPKAPSNGSSTGMFQFHPSTFAKVLPNGNITDPNDQTQAAISLYQQNKDGLAKAGLPTNATTLYLAHQQGLPATQAILGADPNKNAVQTLIDAGIYSNPKDAQKAITNNFGTATMTNGDFLKSWQGKVGRRLSSLGGLDEATNATVAPTPAPAGASLDQTAAAPIPTAIQGKTTRSLSPQEVAAAGYAPGAVVQRDPAGVDSVKADGFTPQVLNTIQDGVTKSKQYDEYTQGNDAYKAMISAANLNPGGMRAYALRDTFARVINPGAVARAGTIEAIKKSQGVPAAIRGYFDNLDGDGDVPPVIAQQILDVAQGFAQSHYASAKALNDANASIYTPMGIDPRRVTAPMEDAPPRYVLGAGPVLDPVGAAKLPTGASFVGMDGKKRVRK